MAYATRDDIESLYGRDLVALLVDQDDDYPNDADARITAALQAASDEIDSYIMASYSLPLASPSPQLKNACRDMAIYRLALNPGPRTDEMRKRYEDWIKWLTLVAKGQVHLVPPVVTPDPNAPADPNDTNDGTALPKRGFNSLSTMRG